MTFTKLTSYRLTQDQIPEASASQFTADTTTITDPRRASRRILDLAVAEEAEVDIVMQVLDATTTDAMTIGEAEAAFVEAAGVAVVLIAASMMSKCKPTAPTLVVRAIVTTTRLVV